MAGGRSREVVVAGGRSREVVVAGGRSREVVVAGGCYTFYIYKFMGQQTGAHYAQTHLPPSEW